MNRFLISAVLQTVLLVAAPWATAAKNSAAPTLDRINTTKTLRVGMSGNQPPFNFKSTRGDMMGLDVDLATALARAINVELEVVQKPFGELLPALEAGEVDLVISGVTGTLQRNMRAAFVGPYFVTGKAILTRSSTLAEIQQASDMDRDVRIAALRGSTSEEFVRKAMPATKLTTTDDYDGSIDLLLSNKVDAIVADAPICQLLVQRWPDAGLVTSSEPLTMESIGIAIRPDDPLFVNMISNYLGALTATGALEQLLTKWFKNGSWLTMLP